MSTIRLACPQGCWWRDNTRGDEIEGKLPLWRKGGRLNWRCKRGKRAARGWETARWSLWLCFVCPLKSECHRIKLPFKNWFFFFSSSFQGTTEADWITNRWSKLLSSFHRLLHFNGASIYLLFFFMLNIFCRQTARWYFTSPFMWKGEAVPSHFLFLHCVHLTWDNTQRRAPLNFSHSIIVMQIQTCCWDVALPGGV